ncbi:N-acetyl-gamma-glutamyl-phosphate reductase [Flavobacteriaceae bacterium]|jgi:N-acetyl-gamma-glutamyl-phosphate reductase|nr:N-acetyl-gamma-glutamyl-phosphate reductase [Flavobacteriaceae bacterium]MDA9239886.1 N-acetyl-gamma-glutamyl-phosphate reductase [Flavobacteriaceae bacterium]MDB9713089.1 N-acetyl-gamma-glutamyl-phosphate reductase [Flavobacteriaceae bacterium]MDB9902734.1 N-acetyl-gamma-glutamyl-phosphate reductase [Flavobacteriaceae bacterium]MDC1393239.1 N-acetyl-gamma-glutamyl-phosphate reductase [Flavobacteriaceae bacterium]|tara:strand:+ start:14554 stop:15552 length:999 start_codon:yes stop_codon:yes gene_type:complete
MIQIGIIGGSGYTGGELIRLLINHPAAEINFVYSRTKAGEPLYRAHEDLLGSTDLCFTDSVDPTIDLVFLCLGHGHSKDFLEKNPFSDATKIIDLSTDFRAQANASLLGKTFVYGLPEKNKSAIENAQFIANPGCFATALQLALLPLAKAQKLSHPVHINGTTGSTGAGIIPGETTHNSWRNNNLSWYKAFNHQHLGEVREQLSFAGTDGTAATRTELPPFYFIPNRGAFSRGIFATLYTEYQDTIEAAKALYNAYYEGAPYTHLSEFPIDLKQVTNTNQCHIHLHKHENQLLITVAIDNLLKGASGQAVQNMNLIFGWEETLGLQLKANRF